MKEIWPIDGVENIPKLFEIGERRAGETYDEVYQNFFGHEREVFTRVTAAEFETVAL